MLFFLDPRVELAAAKSKPAARTWRYWRLTRFRATSNGAAAGEEERREMFMQLPIVLDKERQEERDAKRLEELLAPGTSVWSEEANAVLRGRFRARQQPGPRKARRGNQDYTTLRHLLRAKECEVLQSGVGLRQKAIGLRTFGYDVLELTLPSEMRYDMVTAMCCSILLRICARFPPKYGCRTRTWLSVAHDPQRRTGFQSKQEGRNVAKMIEESKINKSHERGSNC